MKVGDRVKWRGQTIGYHGENRGSIVAIVPPNEPPERHIPGGHSMIAESLSIRPHESYLIQIDSNLNLYWPPIGDLRLIGVSKSEHRWTLKEIKDAFWKTFHRSGEHWFDYIGSEEECSRHTASGWDAFRENL